MSRRPTLAAVAEAAGVSSATVDRVLNRIVGAAGISVADYLAATQLLDEIALDRYSFVRDAYLSRRRSLVFDGDPPDLPEPAASAPK